MDMHVRVDLTVKSRNTYESYLNRGVLDSLGKFKMSKIKPYHIVVFFKEQKENGERSLKGKYVMLKIFFPRL